MGTGALQWMWWWGWTKNTCWLWKTFWRMSLISSSSFLVSNSSYNFIHVYKYTQNPIPKVLLALHCLDSRHSSSNKHIVHSNKTTTSPTPVPDTMYSCVLWLFKHLQPRNIKYGQNWGITYKSKMNSMYLVQSLHIKPQSLFVKAKNSTQWELALVGGEKRRQLSVSLFLWCRPVGFESCLLWPQ